LDKKRILVLGGARSGKSQFAQDRAQRTANKVLFVATAEALDDEMKQRITAHQQSRPQHWQTLEVSRGVGKQMAKEIRDAELVVIDCITLLVSNILTEGDIVPDQAHISVAEKLTMAEVADIVDCMNKSSASFIIVSNEVGLGLVPGSPLERAYRDILGRANQSLAKNMDEVYLLVAGIPIEIKGISKTHL